MTRPSTGRLARNPPVRPERVMPFVTLALTVVALGLVGVGLWTLRPLAGLPGSASVLLASTLVFGALLIVVARVVGRGALESER